MTRALVLRLSLCLFTSAIIWGAVSQRGHARAPRPVTAGVTTPHWRFNPKATTLDHYAKQVRHPHRLTVTKLGSSGWDRRLTFRHRGKVVLRWKGHFETAFLIVKPHLLVIAQHSPIATGCELRGIDLRTGRHLWSANLKGIGPIGHSKYRNRLNLSLVGPPHTVMVFGWESGGRYIEVVDIRTGKTVAHQFVP